MLGPCNANIHACTRPGMRERSAGAVVFTRDGDERRFLLLYNQGRWDFAKGGIEKGETEEDTCVREVREESGLSRLKFVPGFRLMIQYYYRRGGETVHKSVVFFLARSNEVDVRVSDEHQGFAWFRYEDAVRMATYDNSKRVLKAANRFLRKQGRGGQTELTA